MGEECDDFIFVQNEGFIFLNTEYKSFCLDIINNDTVTMIYPFNKFINELLYKNTLNKLFNQCKIDYDRCDVYLDDNVIKFPEFITHIKTKYTDDDIKKCLVFLSQVLYAKIVIEIGLLLKNNYIGECTKIMSMKYYLYNNDTFISKKILRIFGINNLSSNGLKLLIR